MISKKRETILITGGAGFIGGWLVKKLIILNEFNIINVDKLSYASDLSIINELLDSSPTKKNFYKFIKVDLCNYKDISRVLSEYRPKLVFHLAAESHVDRSIDNPSKSINNNILGTLNLLESIRNLWSNLSLEERNVFRLIHISTDEVFGSLGNKGLFKETTKYDPNSPYSASKAASDHLVKAWNKTYGIPSILTFSSNNFGPEQFPEKFIPTIILKALKNDPIPIYGKGDNIRDWLFVEDHVEALLVISKKGKPGQSYCIGGFSEMNNMNLANRVCEILDIIKPKGNSYKQQIKFVYDRPGHDFRYAIDSSLLREELSWEPRNPFEINLELTIRWYLDNLDWCYKIMDKSLFKLERLGRKKLNF